MPPHDHHRNNENAYAYQNHCNHRNHCSHRNNGLSGAGLLSESGMTLIELLMALALLGLVLAAIYLFFFYAHNSVNTSSAGALVLQDARLAVAQIGNDVRNAEKPLDGSGNPVSILDTGSPYGSGLDIYCVENGEHLHVIYTVDANGILNRGASTHAGSGYPPVSPAPYPGGNSTMRIINDSNQPVFSIRPGGRLLVEVDLQVGDSEPGVALSPIEVRTAINVRSGD